MKRRAILMAVGLTAPTMAPAQFVRPGPPAEAIKSFSQNPDRRGSAWRDSAAPFIGSETRKIERGIRAGEKSGDITADCWILVTVIGKSRDLLLYARV